MSQEPPGPLRPAFAPLFDESGAGVGASRKAPISFGSAQGHRSNLEEIRSGGLSTSMSKTNSSRAMLPSGMGPEGLVPQVHRPTTTASSSSSPKATTSVPFVASSQPSASGSCAARVVQNDVDDVERRMFADQRHAFQSGSEPQKDIYDAEYQRIVAATTASRCTHVHSAAADEFDF